MASTELRLSRKKDASGKSEVFVKLTLSKSCRPCFKSGIYVSPEWFKPVSETKHGFIYGIVPPKKGRFNLLEIREASEAKTKIENFVNRLSRVCIVLSEHKKELTRDDVDSAFKATSDLSLSEITFNIIDELKNKVSGQKDFFGWYDTFVSKKNLSVSRERSLYVLARILARYQGFIRHIENPNFTLDIDSIDKERVEDFFDYMANEKELSEEYRELFDTLLKEYPAEISPKHDNNIIEERGHNILVSRKKAFKSFFNWLNAQGITSNRPFDGILIGSEKYGVPYYLSLEERNKIADFDLSYSKHLETQRDIFIFQCLVGMRVSDLMQLTSDNLSYGILEYVPVKTRGKKPFVVRVPLNERAKRLVDKYEGGERLFPFISKQKYNDSIKEVLTACDIKRRVTVINSITGIEEHKPLNEIASSHLARRTFIGNLYKRVKDPNLIGSMSGHSEGSKAFARYRDIDDEIKQSVVALIE